MKNATIKSFIHDLLQSANIQINGNNPWDIQIYQDAFYPRVFKEQSLGLGESYMDNWWDCKQLDQFFERVMYYKLENKVMPNFKIQLKWLLAKLFNHQTKKRALEVGRRHYDIGNTLFQYMLDPRMNYSCGYWKEATDLNTAQRNKLELCCQKLMLSPDLHILDIGCGFGAFAKYASENYGVKVTGITISKKQYEYAKQNCAGLPVDIRFQDYRDITGKYDRIVSIGMFEHVGPLNYPHYFKIAKKSLKENGLFLLHTIGSNMSHMMSDEWIAKYIFPEGVLPSIAQIANATEGLLIMEDWHNFGADYDKTLMAWHENFNQHWESLKKDYDERFYRMWNYYLLSCAGSFRARYLELWQIVFSNNGVIGGYQAPR